MLGHSNFELNTYRAGEAILNGPFPIPRVKEEKIIYQLPDSFLLPADALTGGQSPERGEGRG